MKKYFSGILHRVGVVLFLALAGGAGLSSCSKDEGTVNADYSATDDALIKSYLATNNITTAQKQTSGLYFVPTVTNANAPKVTAGKNVSFLYTGTLLNGTVFSTSGQDASKAASFVLGNPSNSSVILGLQEGISLMHVGDKATLLIPSGLAFGAAGNGSTVPANTVVRFDVEVVDLNYSATDDALIKSYLATNNITIAQKQTSGLYFVPTVTNANAPKVTAGKNVSFLYTGTLLNGTVFGTSGQDASKAASFVLGNSTVIAGLQEGISLMHVGDKATLLIPSGLAFGPSGNGSASSGGTVPANTVVRFDVEVVDLNYAATDDAIIQKYITANNITGAQKQPSGLYYVPTTTNAAGTPATAGKSVSVLYTGKLLDGTTFDASSLHGNAPITFTLGAGQVIPGWDEGIALMRKGEKATLLIPSALAYGPTGAGTTIPANSVLRFEVELTDVK